jgi:hypothetical protein
VTVATFLKLLVPLLLIRKWRTQATSQAKRDPAGMGLITRKLSCYTANACVLDSFRKGCRLAVCRFEESGSCQPH